MAKSANGALNILLTASLDKTSSIASINAAIASIQNKITKLQLRIDTKALKNAGVILQGLQGQVAKANQAANNAANNATGKSGKAVKQYKYDMDELRKSVKRVRDEIGKDNPSQWSVTKNAKGNITSATVSYTNEMGKQIQKNLGWVTKEVGGVVTKTFGVITTKTVENTNLIKNKMQSVLNTAQNLRRNLETGKTNIFDDPSKNGLINSYKGLEHQLTLAQSQGKNLHASTIKNIEAEIAANKRKTEQYIRDQKEMARVANLGTQKIGNITGGMNVMGASFSDIRNMVANAIGSHTNKIVSQDSVAVTSRTIDKSTGQAVAKLTADVENGKDKFIRYKIAVDQASGAIRIFGENIRSTANRNLSFMQQFATAMERIPLWMAGMTVFYQSLHFFTDGVAYVNELNKSLTELSMVFMDSQTEVAKYGKIFHDLGMEMGIATQEVAKGAVEYARQGLGATEMIDKMRTATVYAKISNLDFNSSAQILTATVNSMGVSAERATDVFSFMGDATATGADEIGRAMQRVGGTAGSIGLEFEKVASWVATISSRTRESAETIGNSIKSIVARVQSLKEKGFDSEDGTTYNQVAKALSQIGINLVDTNGQFRNFGTVMDELGAKWHDLDSKQQAYIATTVAGSYQQSRFLNIMEGYDDSVKLYTRSLTSAGTALEKFDLYQEGTEAHLTKLKNAWDGVFQSTFASNGINTLIDGLTVLATGFDNLVKKIGFLPILVALGVGLLFVGQKFRLLYASMIPTVAGFKALPGRITASIASLRAWAASATMASVATRALGLAMRFLMAAAPMIAFIAIAYGIQKITDSMMESKRRAQELADANAKVYKSLKENGTATDDLIKKYKDMNSLTENGTNFHGDLEKEKEYYDVSTQLADLLPSLTRYVDAKGNAHIKVGDALERELKLLQEIARIEGEKNLQKASDELDKKIKAYEKASVALTLALGNSGTMTSSGVYVPDPEKGTNPEFDAAKQLKLDEMSVAMETAQQDVNDFVDNIVKQAEVANNVQFGDEIRNEIMKIVNGLDKSDPKKMVSNIRGIVTEFTKVQEQLGAKTRTTPVVMDELSKSFGTLRDSLSKFTGSNPDRGLESVSQALYNVFIDAKKAEETTLDYEKASEKLNESYNNTADVLGGLNSLLQDNAEGKAISADEVMKLVEKDKTLVDMFRIENGVIKLNTEAIAKKKTDMINALADETEAQRIALVNQNEILLKKFDLFQAEIDGTQTVADAYDKIDEKTALKAKDITSMSEGVFYSQEADKAKEAVTNLDRFRKQAELIKASLQTVGTSAPAKDKKTGSSPDKYDTNKDYWQNELDKYDLAVKASQNLQSTLDPLSDKYRKEVAKEIELWKKRKETAHAAADSYRQQKASIESQLKAMGSFEKQNDKGKTKWNDLKKKLDDVTDSITSMGEAWWDATANIDSKEYELVSSKLGEFDQKIKGVDDQLGVSQAIMNAYKDTSKEHRAEVEKQIGLYKEKQAILHDEANYVKTQLKNDKLTIAQKRDLEESLRQLSIEWWNLQGSINGATQSLVDFNTSVADDAINLLKDMYDKQKDAILKTIDDQDAALDEAHNNEMDRLDDLYNAQEKVIDSKLKKLALDKSERDYTQGYDQKQTEINKIQTELSRLSMDNSLEGQARTKDLKEKLAQAQLELDNMVYDHSVEKQQDALEAEKDAAKEKLDLDKENAQFTITVWDATSKQMVTISGKTYDELKKDVAAYKDKASQYFQDISDDEKYWSDLSAEITKGNVDGIIGKFGELKKWFDDNLPLIGEKIKTSITDRLKDVGSSLSDINGNDPTAPAPSSGGSTTGNGGGTSTGGSASKFYIPKTVSEEYIIKQMIANGKLYTTETDAKKKQDIYSRNQDFGKKLGATFKSTDGKWYKEGLPLYHEGGIVDGASNPLSNVMNQMMNTNANEQVIKALKGELMSPSQNIAKRFIPNLNKLIASISPNVAVSAGGNTYNINIASVTGDKKGADTVTTRIVKEIKKLGGTF